MLNFLLYLDIPSGACISGCPTKPSCEFLSFRALFVTFPFPFPSQLIIRPFNRLH